MNEATQVEPNEEGFLGEILDFDITDIPEFSGFEPLPIGDYLFEVKEPKFIQLERDDDGNRRVLAGVVCEVLEVLDVKNSDEDESKLVGRQHEEVIFISESQSKADIDKSFGRLRLTLRHMGANNEGVVRNMIEGAVGLRFKAAIRHRANKNGGEPFANLSFPKRLMDTNTDPDA